MVNLIIPLLLTTVDSDLALDLKIALVLANVTAQPITLNATTTLTMLLHPIQIILSLILILLNDLDPMSAKAKITLFPFLLAKVTAPIPLI